MSDPAAGRRLDTTVWTPTIRVAESTVAPVANIVTMCITADPAIIAIIDVVNIV